MHPTKSKVKFEDGSRKCRVGLNIQKEILEDMEDEGCQVLEFMSWIKWT